jgi:methionine aminotransferase
MYIESKLPQIGTTIFTVMSQMAQQHQAINLAQGFPDFSCSPELLELVKKHLNEGFNQYAPMAGISALREQIAEKTHFLYGYSPSPDSEITITCGATEACYTAITTFVKPGDEILVFEPAFDSYVPAIKLSGGIPVFVQLSYPDFQIPWHEVEAKITAQTKMIIVNSPHNPTGSILSAEDIQQLERLTQDTNIIILSDEVYEHMVFDGAAHYSLLKSEILRKRTLTVFSFGKTFHVTGWRVGYCIANPILTKEFRTVHQYNTFCAPTPFQLAIADFLPNQQEYLSLPDFYQKKRDYFLKCMDSSKFTAIPSAGTFFQLFSYKNISDISDQEMAIWLTKEIGVAAIPISVFYHSGLDQKIVRFCFAKENLTLEKAAERLCKI